MAEIGAFINAQTEDTTPDKANDLLLSYDASASAVKKVKMVNVGGTGDIVGPASAADGNLAVFDGTTGKLLKDGGTIPALPWQATIMPIWTAPSSVTGTWVTADFGGLGSRINADQALVNNTSNAQNDLIGWKVAMSAGTWTIAIHARKSTNTAIATVKIDGSAVGTLDTYAGSAVYAKISLTGVSVAAGGVHEVTFTAATRNASNTTGWLLELFAIDMIRTA